MADIDFSQLQRFDKTVDNLYSPIDANHYKIDLTIIYKKIKDLLEYFLS